MGFAVSFGGFGTNENPLIEKSSARSCHYGGLKIGSLPSAQTNRETKNTVWYSVFTIFFVLTPTTGRKIKENSCESFEDGGSISFASNRFYKNLFSSKECNPEVAHTCNFQVYIRKASCSRITFQRCSQTEWHSKSNPIFRFWISLNFFLTF